MSSLLKKVLCRMMPILIAASFCSTLHAANTAEQVGLKIGSDTISSIGKRGCTESIDVIVQLTATLQTRNDFQAVHKEVKKETDTSKTKGEGLCDAKLAVGRKSLPFTKATPHIAIKELMTPSACQGEGVSEGRVLCIYEGAGSGDELVGYALYRIETQMAKIESIDDRSAANGEVSFEVKIGGKHSSSVTVETCYGKTADGDIDAKKDECPDNDKFKTHKVNSTKVTISGLDPEEYAFKVRTHDSKDGPGEWFESFKETPIPVAYPLEGGYKGKGGELEFNCQQSGGGGNYLLLVVTMLGLILMRSRMRAKETLLSIALCAAASTVLMPIDAHAELGQVSFGILGSMYRPDLDSETTANGSKIFPFYKCFFRKKTGAKEGPINPLMGGEVDVHLWDGIGSLQLGLGFGYTFVNGRAVKLDKDGNPDCDSPADSVKSTLHMYQIRPQLTYVFDYFAESFPIVPYFRASMIGHGYMFRNGSSAAKSTTVDGITIKPNGFRFGYQAAIGLMLMLDFLEPTALQSSRGLGYLDHVFLKAELSASKIDSFGRSGFRFTPKDIMGSAWPLMWTFGLVFELP